MRKLFILLATSAMAFFLFFWNRNYDSARYYRLEEQAIQDILPEMVGLKNMMQYDHFKNGGINTYLINQLDTFTVLILDPHYSNQEQY
ncbi:MAG: hypothetical protein AAFV80_18575, partial [Bacteroidota bacterium]